MKRYALLSLSTLFATLATGCPIFDENHDALCDPQIDAYCGPSSSTGNGPSGCTKPSDCIANETCGDDNQCHSGDCTFWGCVTGYECNVDSEGKASCGQGGSGGQGGTGGEGGDPNTYCGNPDDCGEGETCGPDGTCQPGDCSTVGCVFGYVCDDTLLECVPSNPAACISDDDCGMEIGIACINGICTPPEDQCFDQTQCGPGQVCADGKCTDDCNGDRDCSPAYLCEVDVGLCSVPSEPCQITSDCGSAEEICVDGACVPKSPDGTCDEGFVWVGNGCIPNQAPTFVCDIDGTQDACASGSICLHHSCYISCESPNQNACNVLPQFNICKPVSSISGEHDVCGSNQNLGDECSPVTGESCAAGKICVDGFCK